MIQGLVGVDGDLALRSSSVTLVRLTSRSFDVTSETEMPVVELP